MEIHASKICGFEVAIPGNDYGLGVFAIAFICENET